MIVKMKYLGKIKVDNIRYPIKFINFDKCGKEINNIDKKHWSIIMMKILLTY